MPTRFRIAPELTLRAGDAVLALSDVQADVVQGGGPASDVVLVADVSPEDADRALEHGWLHTEPEHRSARSGGAWRPGVPVRLEARLTADLLTAASLLGDDVWDVLAEVRFARTLPAMHDVASWYALRLTQPDATVPGVRMGLQTTWANERV